jgi:hypothetical protein
MASGIKQQHRLKSEEVKTESRVCLQGVKKVSTRMSEVSRPNLFFGADADLRRSLRDGVFLLPLPGAADGSTVISHSLTTVGH